MSEHPPYPAPVDIPVCPRHPGRESHVRCQRCHRPVCPECQRPAAVGVQCVDCVHEQARSDRPAVTVFGGRAHDPGWASKVIIAVCVVLFLGQMVRPALTNELAFAPVVGWSEPWRMLTAAFLHSPSNYLHIAFNMLCLWQIGPYLEGLLGRTRFVVLYLVSAIGGSAGVVLIAAAPTSLVSVTAAQNDYQSWFTGVVGASGAVFGLFGALLVLNRHLGRTTAGIGITILLNAVLGFIVPGIAWQAHVGGFVTGLACAGVIALLNKEHLRRYALAGLVGVLAVVVAAMAVKYSAVPPVLR